MATNLATFDMSRIQNLTQHHFENAISANRFQSAVEDFSDVVRRNQGFFDGHQDQVDSFVNAVSGEVAWSLATVVVSEFRYDQ